MSSSVKKKINNKRIADTRQQLPNKEIKTKFNDHNYLH